MTISLDLSGVTDKESLFHLLDRVLLTKPWGHNWDALTDCLRHLSDGEFSDTYAFPLTIELSHVHAFEKADPKSFHIFTNILDTLVDEYAMENQELLITRV